MKFEVPRDWSALPDKELAFATREGHSEAFEEIVRRHQGRVYAVAYRLTGNREDALDVAQDSMVKAYRKIDAWRPTGNFLPWLLRLTTNQAIDFIRRRKRQSHTPLDENLFQADDPDRPRLAIEPANMDTRQRVRAREIDARIRRSLRVLSETQRTVFILRHFEGLQLNDIAEELGCTVGSVKVHLFRALKKLQRELGDLYED